MLGAKWAPAGLLEGKEAGPLNMRRRGRPPCERRSACQRRPCSALSPRCARWYHLELAAPTCICLGVSMGRMEDLATKSSASCFAAAQPEEPPRGA